MTNAQLAELRTLRQQLDGVICTVQNLNARLATQMQELDRISSNIDAVLNDEARTLSNTR